MTIPKGHIIAALVVTTAVVSAVGFDVHAQSAPTEQVHMEQAQCFDINRSKIGKPSTALGDFSDKVGKAWREDNLTGIRIVGAASPDGPYSVNRRLSEERAQAVGRYLSAQSGVPAKYINVSSIPEDWDKFDRFIGQSLSADDCAKVRLIVSSTANLDERERKLRRAEGGRIWRILVAEVLPLLRCVTIEAELKDHSTLTFTLDNSTELPAPDLGPEPGPELTPQAGELSSQTETETLPQAGGLSSQAETDAQAGGLSSQVLPYHWYVKTNLAAWAMLVANVQAEMDVVSHLSVMLPIYYSGWDYFKSTLKYRTFTVLPEVRYWPRGDNQGFFAGLHGGFSYYNVALDGNTRWQDHDGNTPAWGGGLTVGYRLPIRKSSPWQFEFSVGAGVYTLDYDTFHNYKNGLLTGRHKKTFFGIDNFAITLSYRFDQKRYRKGGAQ